MGSASHLLCLRYSENLTPTALMAISLWETFTLCDASGAFDRINMILILLNGWLDFDQLDMNHPYISTS